MPRKAKEGIYERNDSPCWWASFTDSEGRRVRRSTGVPVGAAGRQEAEAILAKWKLEVHQQRMWGKEADEVRQRHTFDEVMLAYLRGHKTRTPERRRLSTIKPLYPVFHGRYMDTITDHDVKQYMRMRALDVSPGTINKEVGVFSAACNFCRDELGWQIGNPAARKKMKEPEGRVRWLSHEEAGSLIDAARQRERAPWLADFIQLCLYTGMRRGEATSITWKRVDLSRRLILLEAENTKSARRRTVPLHPIAVEALHSRRRWCDQHCPDTEWVFCNKKGEMIKDMKKSFAAAKRDAGISDFRQHDQRHTLASWMVMSGTELMKVRDMLGHSSVKLTERYAHLHPDALREAVDNLVPARNSHASTGMTIQHIEGEAGRPRYH
ncbi:site-specific integrase [Salinicola endophyticus]|uniref:Site-specific integrase n=1 Tax=Salinicola endophyticus TaxID=1949083 RepID=A0AB74U392_9GAMM